jgi:hypothetical protein
MTNLYYSFTYGTPLPIGMSTFAFSSAGFHDNGAQSLATISLDSIVIILEPATFGLFALSSLALWVASKTSPQS